MIFRSFILLCLIIWCCPGFSQTQLYQRYIISGKSDLSSPTVEDLNDDGNMDIIIAYEDTSEFFKLIAIDQANDTVLWNTALGYKYETFGRPKSAWLNNDSIPDFLVSGRDGLLNAINGSTGETLWDFWNYTDLMNPPSDSGWFNFYNPVILEDLTDDGVPEILISNGGNSDIDQNDTLSRVAGRIAVISGMDGSVFMFDSVPDGNEIYCPALIDSFGTGDPVIVFGTGGETIGGGLYRIPLQEYLSNGLANSELLFWDSTFGFVPAPSFGDLNADGIRDIAACTSGQRIVAIDGQDNELLWELSITGYSSYATPTLGHFNSLPGADIFITVSHGFYPVFDSFYQVVIDGATGNFSVIDSIGHGIQLAQAVAGDVNDDGQDEIFLSVNLEMPSTPENLYGTVLVMYDPETDERTLLSDTIFDSVNSGATPILSNLGNTSSAKVVWAVNQDSQGQPQYTQMRVIEVDGSSGLEPSWSGYLGSGTDGIFESNEILVEIARNEDHNISVFPNPSSSQFRIKSEEEIQRVEIIDVQGRVLYHSNHTTGNELTLASNLAPGIYTLRINDRMTGRIVISW